MVEYKGGSKKAARDLLLKRDAGLVAEGGIEASTLRGKDPFGKVLSKADVKKYYGAGVTSVSYTHLTLPTNREV